jgi:hypothetical protein
MIEKLSNASMAGGSVTAVVSGGIKYFGLSASEWTLVFAAVGAVVAVAGFFVSWYYKAQALKLARQRMLSALED